MPSEYQASGGRDVEQYPGLEEDIGENPARFLDWEIIGHDRADFVKARIRGIDTVATARAWKAVERDLGYGPNDGPREGVIRLLEQREEHLEQVGDRPDRLEHGPRRPPSMLDTESVIPDRDQRTVDEKLADRTEGTA